MTRKWFNAGNDKSRANRKENRQRRPQNELCRFEQLEDRRLLAFVGFFNGVTLDLVQTFDDGDVVVDNSGLGGAFRVTDNSGSLTFVDSTNVSVTMLNNTANQLNFRIQTTHTGNVVLNLGNGPRDVVFDGFGLPGIANTAGGSFTVHGGTGPQFINLAPVTIIPIPFQTGGDATFDLGTGFDTVYNNENFVRIGGDLSMTGVNLFRYTDFLFPVPLNADLMVGGNVTMDTSNESIESFLIEGGTFHDDDPDVPLRTVFGGSFTYIGGDDIDHVNLNDTYVMGDLIIDLGDGTPFFGDPQNVTTTLTLPPILGGPYGQIDGNISISGGDSNLGNVITLDGAFNGDTVDFNFGNLVDSVYYALIGTQADVTASMGGGNDIFEIVLGVNVLDIDFGNDFGDQLINSYGKFTFDSDVTNFHQFDHLYTEGDDTLILTQLVNTGNVTIDNDGGPVTGIDWRVSSPVGGSGSTTTAANLTINMLSNTGNNVVMDLKNPVIATIAMNLGDGNRNVDFVGTSNNPLRDLSINAGLGIQNIELAVNAPLAVATLNINLGAGFDTVDEDGSNLMISEDLILTGVNLFETDGVLSVARNVVVDSTVETENTTFAANKNTVVGSSFTYTGGDGNDTVRLNGTGGTSIIGNVSIDLGDNTLGGTQSVLINGAFTVIGGKLDVISTGFVHPDNFQSAATTSIGGNINIDLGGGQNTANMVGVFGGTKIDYTGGSGVDTVTLGTTGNPAQFNIVLGDGDDVLTIQAGTSIAPGPLTIDFGDDNDTFVNNYGLFDFDFSLLGLRGFNHVFDLGASTLTSTQVSDPGPVTVDNNGPSNAIRLIDGATTVLVPVVDLNINMLSDSGTNLDVQLDNPFSGDLAINLANGNRALNLTGADNSVGGNLSITGGSGDQIVEVAVNNDLLVNGAALVSLGTGSDTVDEDGNNITILGNLDFAGVNQFINDGITGVGGNLTVNNAADPANSVFDDNATLTVAGNFSFLGGSGRDEVSLNGSAGGSNIGGNSVIDLGNNLSGGTQTALLNNAATFIGGSLTVNSTNATSGDTVTLDPAATYNGDININLGGGANNATIVGAFGGNTINYTGGSGIDTVILGTTGNPASTSIILGAGDDSFTLLAGTSIAPHTLTVDFGDNDDTFDNQYGTLDFTFQLLGLHGFNHAFFQPLTTLTSTQVSDPGTVTVDNNGAGNAIRFINGGVNELVPVTNLNINMLDNSGTDLILSLDNAFAGDLAIDLGNGTRNLIFDGNDNSIGGDLTINGGTGSQLVSLSDNADLSVAGGASFNLGSESDSANTTNGGFSVGGDLSLNGVNSFGGDDNISIGGNFSMSTVGDNADTTFNPDNGGSFLTNGNFVFTGGSGNDRLFLEDNFQVNGSALIDLGDGTNLVDLEDNGGTPTTIVGATRITAGAGNDTFISSDSFTNFGGDIYFHLGNGDNVASILGDFGGTSVTYNGGSGIDDVTFGTTGNLANVNIKLKAGDDSFTLNAGADISPTTLRVDFGGGNDSFVNNFGDFDFDAKLLNWRGYSRFYDLASDAWNIQQVSDSGPVTLDNNGPNDAIRLITSGAVSAMTSATDVRLIMLDNTTNQMAVDFDSPHAGLLVVQMRDGARELNFIGDSNTIGGLLRIEAAADVQNIFLSRNADLNVGLSLVINTRDGSDAVDESNHNINVGGAMILRNVNVFENNNALSVGGDFNLSNSLDTDPTFLYNFGTIDIVGNLTYLGGSGVDDIQFNAGGVNIGDYAYFSLGTGDNPFATQYVSLQGGFNTGQLGIVAGTSLGGNSVVVDGATNISGDVNVNFAGSTTNNSAILFGNYGGTNGSYFGGSAVDTVSIGATAPNMSFAALMEDGNDVFVVEATADLSFLFIDFGPGSDGLVDNLGQPWPFPSTIVNL